MNQSVNIMMSQVAVARARVIHPQPGDIGTLDFAQKKPCLEAGIASAREAPPAVRAAIAGCHTSRGGQVPPPFAEAAR